MFGSVAFLLTINVVLLSLVYSYLWTIGQVKRQGYSITMNQRGGCERPTAVLMMPSEERSRGRQAGKREVLVAREQPSPRAVSNAFQNRAHVPALAWTMTLCSNLTNYTLTSIPTRGKHISGRVWVSAQCL